MTSNPSFVSFVLSLIVGYGIGSLPVAFLVVKFSNRVDLRKEGSGNIGAMNAYEVTKSGMIGVFVMLGDLLKGVAAIIGMMSLFGPNNQPLLILGGLGAVVGHNYPVWLRFKGGKGLSTTAGVMLVLCWLYVILWCALWALAYAYKHHLHLSNIVATILCPLIILSLPGSWLQSTLPQWSNSHTAITISMAISFLILVKHGDEIKHLLHAQHH